MSLLQYINIASVYKRIYNSTTTSSSFILIFTNYIYKKGSTYMMLYKHY